MHFRFRQALGLLWVAAGLAVAQDSLAQCARTGPWALSDVASTVLSRIENNPTAQAYSPVPLAKILSTCNRFVSVQVDGPAIFQAAYDIIAAADHEVDIAFYKWDPNSQAARRIGEALIAAQWRRTPYDRLLVRMVVDDVDNYVDPGRKINGLYDSQKMWVSMGLDLSRVELQLGTSPRDTWVSAALHDKIIVVDSRLALVTGSQPEKSSDAPTSAYRSGWHDAGFVVEGDAAQSSLAAFDHTWNGDAHHWTCTNVSWGYDCQKRSSKFPQPWRWWEPAYGSTWAGDVPVLAVGRTKGSAFDNDTNNPQAIAWLTAFERATSHVHVETPNVNDDAFQNAVKSAVARGVRVRLITSLGFNDMTEDAPSLGGDNLEVIGRLRQAIRAETPWYQDRFEVGWYSKWGLEPVTGNGTYASHTKYLTMDDRVAVVGSGNQDTVSWNVSHEYNLLFDDPGVTVQAENAIFLPDWSRATKSYLELYEGNGGTQDVVCSVGILQNKSKRFGDPWFDGNDYPCNNDEARSVLIHDAPAGKVFRVYDDPERRFQEDDWTEIVVKRPVSRKYVDTFERSYEDDDVRVIFHRDNGLDGKISSLEVATAPVGTTMDLYEGNYATQSLVCSNRIAGTRTITLTADAYCNNDEARSLVLNDFPSDKVIFIYDSSSGSRGDDWTLIVPKTTIKSAQIDTFQRSYETAEYRVCHYPDNGLDGKVSRIRVGLRSEALGYCGVY